MENATNWLTKDLLKKSLVNFHKDESLEIVEFTSKPALLPGENFTSQIVRVIVTFRKNYRLHSMSLIIKTQLLQPAIEALTELMNHFGKEIEMFTKTFPLIYKALGPNFEGSLSSVCLLATYTPNAILVLEDLQPKGFRMASRQKGLDYEHCSLVMKKIAQFHAASLVVIRDDPSVTENYFSGIFTNEDLLKPWIYKAFQSIIEVCLTTKDLEKYGEKLRKLGEDAIKRGVAASDKRPGGFHVINHGDLWTNNFLFSYYPNGELKDLKFVDFQVVKYTSPAMDLHYFFSTSPTDEVRVEHLVNLLNIYYGHLISTLANMKYPLKDVPTLPEFIQDFTSRGFFGIMGAVILLPQFKGEPREDATFENLLQDEGKGSFRHHIYHNKSYLKSIKQIFDYYDKFGIFD